MTEPELFNMIQAALASPAKHFGVIYSTGNASIRRTVHVDHDDSELTNWPLGPGEAMVLVANIPYPSTAAYWNAINNAVQAAAGKAPGDTYCPVVDSTGYVFDAIMADPAIDTYHDDPTAILVPDPTHRATPLAKTGGFTDIHGVFHLLSHWGWTQAGGFVLVQNAS